MALVTRISLGKELRAERFDHSRTSEHFASWSRAFDMSYQYPPPPDDDLVGKAKPSFSLEHDTLPQQLSTPVAKGQDFQPKTLGRETARSYASSSLPPQGMHPSTEPVLEDPSAVPAQGEKKKNRLGYHRISIACSRLYPCVLATMKPN